MKKKDKKNTKAQQKKDVSKLKKALMKLWSQKVRERDGACIHCGIKAGDINEKGKKIVLDAHHLLSRDVKNSPLKFDIRNGATLCQNEHKWSSVFSAHKCPINFYEWFRTARPDQYKFVLENTNLRVNLDNIEILKVIEENLINNQPIDIERIKQIDHNYNNTTTTKTTTTLQDITSL